MKVSSIIQKEMLPQEEFSQLLLKIYHYVEEFPLLNEREIIEMIKKEIQFR